MTEAAGIQPGVHLARVVVGDRVALPEEVRPYDRVRLRGLLVEYSDIFSGSEKDPGRTLVMTQKIDSGDVRPVRQTLRRQLLPYRTAVDEYLDSTL